MLSKGVWVSRHADGSGVWLFEQEVQALRHAVANHTEVVYVPYGQDARIYVSDMRPGPACRGSAAPDTPRDASRTIRTVDPTHGL